MALRIPSVGKRLDSTEFSADINKVKKMLDFMNQSRYLNDKTYNLMTGDPIKFKAYPPAIKKIKKVIKNSLYEYPASNGTVIDKTIIVDYLKAIHINTELNNVTFTYATTHAFNLIFSVLANQQDAIIIPTPNYGLFDFIPERYGVNVLSLPLSDKDDWLVNVEKMEKLIYTYNNNMTNKKNHSRVKYIYIMNPHNPTGKVMGKKEKNILKKIGEIAIKNDIYIIEDLIYRDLCYDENNMPIAISSFTQYRNQVISLFGVSKSYNLASIRSGFIVANDEISSKLQDRIFQTMDSISTINIASLTGSFDIRNKKQYHEYFKQIKQEYLKKYYLLKGMVDGTKTIKNKKMRKYCENKIINYSEITAIKGMNKIQFVNGLSNIESGYFALLKLELGKKQSGFQLFDELYHNANIKIICSDSIVWPTDDCVIRVNFAVDDRQLIKGIYNLNKYLNSLNDK